MAGTTESKLEYLIRSKEDVRLAINRMLVPCPEDTPFLDYGPKIKQVDVDLSDATVTSDDLMEGVIAYDAKEQRLVGTIPDLGLLNFEPSDEEYTIPYGRTNGGKVNKADITKLAEYKACLKIANSVDNLDNYTDTSATAEDIREGKTAYSNGERVVGTMEKNDNNALMSSIVSGGNTTSNQHWSNIYTLIKNLPENVSISPNSYSASNMFAGCSNLEEVPPLDMSAMRRQADYMFYNCSKLKKIELKNTDNITSLISFAERCGKLEEIILGNTSKVTDFTKAFTQCPKLTTFPQIDTSGSKKFGEMFYYCPALKTVPVLNTSKATYFYDMFSQCSALTDESLNNIMQMCINAVAYTSTKTLKNLGLSSAQATRCKSLSNYQAFLDAGWTTGY